MPWMAHVFLIALITQYGTEPGAILRVNVVTQPLHGYRCVTDNSNQTTLWSNARDQCVKRYLSSDECIVVNHNDRRNHCKLRKRPYDRVVSAKDFSINVYGMDRKSCVHWVPIYGFDGHKAAVFGKTPKKRRNSCREKGTSTWYSNCCGWEYSCFRWSCGGAARGFTLCLGMDLVCITRRFVTRFNLWLQHDLWPHNASICDCSTICDHIMLQFVTRHDLWPKVLQFVTSVIQWF